tara:strand:- start:220 stop:375 length:156 start_codon:yes stop_codon:yes gene_type:complete
VQCFFKIQVDSFLTLNKKGLSHQLSSLEAPGKAISSKAQSWIDFTGHTVNN